MITVDLERVAARSHCSILDIGCGSGRHTAAAYDHHCALVVGADANVRDLKDAHDRICLHESLGTRGRWALCGADITDLPFPSQCFDGIICSEVLEHIHDHARAIKETVRVLRRGGILAVSVPRRWPEAVCWMLSEEYRHSPGGHIRIFRRSELIRAIASCGMTHRHTHYAHSLHTPYWWLKCLLGPGRDRLWPVRQYHRLLTWDLMKHPPVTRHIERWLNPIFGKSLVLYFSKT